MAGDSCLKTRGVQRRRFFVRRHLLVVSLEVPRTYDELVATMERFPAFGISFALLILIWHAHYSFFRRYHLEDVVTVILNTALLFLVLFYIYPLKCLARLHAYRKRSQLELSRLEIFDAMTSIREKAIYLGVGLFSVLPVAIGGPGVAFWAGMSYGLLGPAMGLHGYLRGRARDQFIVDRARGL